jgi:hypothetical protein
MVGSATKGLIRKIQRQLAWSTMMPPSSGPIAAEIAEKPAQVPIALPRSASLNDAPMIASEHGISSAAPAPWMARARINCATPVESPQPIDAAANTPVPMTKMRRRPYRSPAAPPTSSSAVSESV